MINTAFSSLAQLAAPKSIQAEPSQHALLAQSGTDTVSIRFGKKSTIKDLTKGDIPVKILEDSINPEIVEEALDRVSNYRTDELQNGDQGFSIQIGLIDPKDRHGNEEEYAVFLIKDNTVQSLDRCSPGNAKQLANVLGTVTDFLLSPKDKLYKN